ncbi:hypothetical protein OA92_06905 [Marinomonas sp. SBI22]|uniref:DUF2608 domain-containing protein n=1 Tax=unclassified Marinomonas TaxID=196814 RepID=UPI0007AF319B|nr:MULTISPECIES: DUF2608 domain-containing protein [unclassified Marinomonas]KZM44384.1 hypothetical protein OA92_06905 [Marinomonas sp. SBI22]KZM45542.1 hypothetical protein OA91_08050 [Marinomonas sp. SBI8L]
MKFIYLVFAMVSVCFSQLVSAESSHGAIASFNDLIKLSEEIDKPYNTLLVMDDDDTISMMPCPDNTDPADCQYLGGPAWFSWQQDQIKKNLYPRVADKFEDLLVASTLLFNLNTMVYSQQEVPKVLKKLTKSGVRLLVETARGNTDISATEQQFARLPISKNKTFATHLSQNSLLFDDKSSKASPYIPCDISTMNTISYRNGAMYLSGQDKGINLKCLLDEFNQQQSATKLTQIIFIDDTLANVISVYKAFKNSPNYQVKALHFTALEKHKAALRKGKYANQHQQNATDKWNIIKDVLQSELKKPIL